MKLKFIIDKDYDLEIARELNFSDSQMLSLEAKYDSSVKYLRESCIMYQESWDKIGESFSDYIENKTGFNWYYAKYECVVSFSHLGISNWGVASKIARIWSENPITMRRVTAQELIISHYFEIFYNEYSSSELSDGQIWALAEIAAIALTSLTEEAKNFWPWFTEYYTEHNYNHIVGLQRDLEEVFLQSVDFRDYIAKGIELIKEFPNISPTGITS